MCRSSIDFLLKFYEYKCIIISEITSCGITRRKQRLDKWWREKGKSENNHLFCDVLPSQSEHESQLLLWTTVDSWICVFTGFYRCCEARGQQQTAYKCALSTSCELNWWEKVTTGSLRSPIECKVPGSRLGCQLYSDARYRHRLFYCH